MRVYLDHEWRCHSPYQSFSNAHNNAKGNMVNIAETVPIDISKTHGIVENVFIGEDCSPDNIQVYTKLFR